ncbi:hypothetical protein PtA15_3A81 [Puccinia triticina]|uniref:Uncharacterized protein n=1 Tax=Puccinia triticina TaxID=208348 RepID=A0ABY7CE29_9BASI|nr:uncharacterized protein PtA15_3A81 [Puccinia triticina]WAQ82717.1 hypothetical protein PtA15_3A81 [Puccinia triticina]
MHSIPQRPSTPYPFQNSTPARLNPHCNVSGHPIPVSPPTPVVGRGVAVHGGRSARGSCSSCGGRGGWGSRCLLRGHPTHSYRPPFRRGGYVPGDKNIMSKNGAIIEAMPQLPPVFASHPRTATTSGSFITPLFPSRSASVYSASSAATAEDFLTPQVRLPSLNPPGFYDPADFHCLTQDQVISLLDRQSAPELFD